MYILINVTLSLIYNIANNNTSSNKENEHVNDFSWSCVLNKSVRELELLTNYFLSQTS